MGGGEGGEREREREKISPTILKCKEKASNSFRSPTQRNPSHVF